MIWDNFTPCGIMAYFVTCYKSFCQQTQPPGSKRYNLAKTFRKMAKKEDGGESLFSVDDITRISRLSGYLKIYAIISNSNNLKLDQNNL